MHERDRARRGRGLSVPKKNAEKAIEFLKASGLLDTELAIIKDGERVVLPLRSEGAKILETLLSRFEADLVEAEFAEKQRRPRSIREALSTTLPQAILEKLPSSYDIVGDIALIHLPRGVEQYMSLIGEAIMRVNPSVKVVLGEAGVVEGVFRLRRLVHLAGQRRTTTTHRENGCVFQVDLSKSYFSPRLSGERMRIAALAGRGETVADMFAGVGPFSITIAKHSGAKVYAAELNPDAYSLLVKNIELNKVRGLVRPLHGDCKTVFLQNQVRADRVVMNYPSDPYSFLESATKILKDEATMHVYGFAEEAEAWRRDLEMRVSSLGLACRADVRVLREVSPRRRLMVADIAVCV
ncbi:MAG: class I SAM-dependent methyltransferase family protein [Nitrososphaerota archaeon]